MLMSSTKWKHGLPACRPCVSACAMNDSCSWTMMCNPILAAQSVRLMTRVLPNKVVLTPPIAEPGLSAWKLMLEADSAALREQANRAALTKVFDR